MFGWLFPFWISFSRSAFFCSCVAYIHANLHHWGNPTNNFNQQRKYRNMFSLTLLNIKVIQSNGSWMWYFIHNMEKVKYVTYVYLNSRSCLPVSKMQYLLFLCNSMEHSPSWETNGSSTVHEFPDLYRTRRFIKCSQEPATDPYLELDESSPLIHFLFLEGVCYVDQIK
jgi:hypothetical protein